MSTWTYVQSLRAEHAEYLAGEGVRVPPRSPRDRAPDEADVAAAHAELDAAARSALVVDSYRSDGEPDLVIAVRGGDDAVLAFARALAARCGPLYLFPFPHDAMPGVVVDRDDSP